ncbi:MAG: glycosyltransferase [Bacteroidales bacterium]|nr:glycosyltransferase [Bacteroidales bacterium]
MSSKEFNVCLFNDSFPPVMDGVSVCVSNYAHWMQKKVGGVAVVTPNVPGAEYDYDFEVMDYFSVPVPFRHPYVTGIAEVDPAFIKRIVSHRFKIVHAHCPFTSGLAAQRVAKFQGIPCVATFHSKYRDDFSRVIPSKKMVDIIIKQIVAFYNKADEVWVPQASVEEVIREYGYKGKVEVVDNGSDLVADYPEKFFVDARKELGIEPDEFVMLFVGQHIWEKNTRFIIDALEGIRDQRFRMLFVGTGYAAEAMKELVAEKGLDNMVSFVGNVTERERITKYYAAADLFLFPSLYDNAPLVVREAAALHTPSVMVRGATASTILTDDSNGFLVENDINDFERRLRELTADPERVRRAGVQASRTIVRSWEDVVGEVLDRYNCLISKRTLISKI